VSTEYELEISYYMYDNLRYMKTFVQREDHLAELRRRLKTNPVVAITGPRQCGKTTLARLFGSRLYLDLENPRDLARLQDPLTVLEPSTGLTVIDEIQRRPELFPVLRVLVDRSPIYRFLVLGSASPGMIRQSSESLAGRISYYELPGFTLEEVGFQHLQRLWLRGWFPKSFLASSDRSSVQWREDFISTFLERDIPELGIRIPSGTLRQFWSMVAHYHGQLIQFSELSRSFGVSDMTVRKYLDILAGTYMVRVIQPWNENVGKRIVKQPKIYISDSGIFHTLLDIRTRKDLETHPKLGASWEGFVLQHLLLKLSKRRVDLYFWRTHAGAEIDFFWQMHSHRYGLEVKHTLSPSVTPSMRNGMKDLRLTKLFLIYPGKESYPLGKKITACSLESFVRSFQTR